MRKPTDKKRVIVYVDGFNLYHAINDIRDKNLQWPSIVGLSEEMIKSKTEQLMGTIYFTAHATHIYKDSFRAKQKEYLNTLKEIGTEIIYGKFKKKYIYCKKCTKKNLHHEEKETDVNIAVRIISDAYKNNFDTTYIISGDTDLLAPIRLVLNNFPDKEIVIVGPPQRGLANELKKSATRVQIITKGQLLRNKINNI